MNNRFKFRAWDRGKEKMIAPHDGDFIKWHAMSNWQECLDVMQFTGLHDKNGVEIYEEDVVRWNINDTEIIGKVEFVLGGYDLYEIREDGKPWLVCWDHFRGDSEIVGNVYENPELLGPNHGA